MADPTLVEKRPDELERWWHSVAKRTIGKLRDKFRLEIYAPPGAPFISPAVLQSSQSFASEVQRFRAKIFFAEGRRPYFRREDGSFADISAADDHAYHLVCRDRRCGTLAGCLRASLTSPQGQSSVAEHIGADRAAQVLGRLGVHSSEVLEMERLAVGQDHRLQGAGEALVVSAHALAIRLACHILWCVSAEGDGQHRHFVRYGATELPGSSAHVPKYSDTACVVIQDLRVILPRVQTAIRMVDQAIFGAANGAD